MCLAAANAAQRNVEDLPWFVTVVRPENRKIVVVVVRQARFEGSGDWKIRSSVGMREDRSSLSSSDLQKQEDREGQGA